MSQEAVSPGLPAVGGPAAGRLGGKLVAETVPHGVRPSGEQVWAQGASCRGIELLVLTEHGAPGSHFRFRVEADFHPTSNAEEVPGLVWPQEPE